MILYKHFSKEEYLNDWLEGCFVLTKLTVFQKKEQHEDHFTDHHEGSVITPIKSNTKLILHDYGDTDLLSYSDQRIYKRIPEEKAKFVLISSFSTETNECLRKDFGQYVLKFDFNEAIQELFINKKIIFNKLSYQDDNGKMFSNKLNPSTIQVIESSYQKLLSKNEDLFKSVLFNKRSKYSDQKEFRFVYYLSKESLKNDSCEENAKSVFEALLGNVEYFPIVVKSDTFKSLKPFYEKVLGV